MSNYDNIKCSPCFKPNDNDVKFLEMISELQDEQKDLAYSNSIYPCYLVLNKGGKVQLQLKSYLFFSFRYDMPIDLI